MDRSLFALRRWTSGRRTHAGRARVLFALLAAVAPAARAQAQFATFDQVDYYWTQNPALFQGLWQAALSSTVRIAILGDSQETNPGGRGLDYIPRLDYEMWKRFGNVPETPIHGCGYYGGGAPYADWLLRGACATPGPSPTRLAPTQILPNVQPYAYSTINGATNFNGEYFGQLTMLQQNAIGVDPAAGISPLVNYFNTSGAVKARIFAATNPSSGEIAYWAQPVGTSSPSYYAPVTTSGVLTLGLQSPNFGVLYGDTTPLDFNGNTYMVLQVAGTDDSKLTDIIGLRFFNATYPQGVVFDTFSLGGYEASTFLSAAANAGAMFQAMGFQAAILHYGANDSGDGQTAQDFQTNILAVMALVRSWVGDPGFPIILIADVYRADLTPAQQSEFDMYVGAQLAIAQSDPNVLVINSRRLMDDIGWNATSGQAGTFLIDCCHYTAYGAQVLAAAEAAAMNGEILVADCAADSGNVSLQANVALTINLGGTTPCAGFGVLSVAQSLTLDQPTLNIVLTGGFVPAIGQSFQILAAGSLSGTFGTINLPALPAGSTWDTSSLYTTGTITVVPGVAANATEVTDGPLPPWAYALLAAGLLWIAARRLRLRPA